MPRRRLLLVTQSLMVVASLVLGTLVVTGAVQFWHIYLISLTTATVMAFDVPARTAMFPTLVPRHQMQHAVALSSMIFRLSTFIGPAISGVLIALYGIGVPFFVNAASYFAIIFGLLLMRLPPTQARAPSSLRADALSGLRYARHHAILPLILMTEACLSIFGANQALYTIFARDVLDVGATGLGFMLSSVGFGAILGASTLIAVGNIRQKGRVMIGAGTLYAGAIVAFAWSRSLPLTLAILFVLGYADALWGAMRGTIAQLATADAYRGRVMSLLTIVTRGLTQFSHVETGAAVSLLGPTFAAALGGGMVAAVVVTLLTRVQRLRDFRSDGRAVPVEELAAAD